MKAHRVHFSDLRDTITHPGTHSCLIDIRPELQYARRHLRQAINIKPELWRNKSVDGFIETLRSLKVHLLILHAAYLHEKSEKDRRAGPLSSPRQLLSQAENLADQMGFGSPHFQFIVLQRDSLDSSLMDVEFVVRLFEQIADSKEKIKKLLHRDEHALPDELPRITVRHYSKSYEEMGPKYDALITRDQEEKSPSEGNSEIEEVIPLSLYIGRKQTFLQYVEQQIQKDPAQIRAEQRDPHLVELDWHGVSTLYSFADEPPVIPENILLQADCSHTYGERIIYQQKEITEESPSPGHMNRRKKLASKLTPFRKTKTTVTRLEVDENLTEIVYSFPNGYSFTWNVIQCPRISQLPTYLRSAANFMEASGNMQLPFMICQGPFAVISLVYYFLLWRRWSVQRSFRYLYHKVGDRLIELCKSEYFIEGIVVLFEEEAKLLPHLFPSTNITSFLVFWLDQQPCLIDNLTLTRHSYDGKREDLFTYIRSGDVNHVREILKDHPYLAEQITRLPFDGLEEQDYTPLLLALEPTTCPSVRQNRDCMELLATPQSIFMSSLAGHGPLYYAIEVGDEMVQYLLSRRCYYHRCSRKLRMNPLQRAIKFRLRSSTLIALMNRFTVNHRDSFHRTPAHYIIEEFGNDVQLTVILIEELVSHGGDLFLGDANDRTPLMQAADRSEALAQALHHIVVREGSARYQPFASYAKGRENIHAEYFVDGEETFLAIEAALLQAKRVVYIASHWLTPQIALNRRDEDPKEWEKHRLDNILKALANSGVSIRILLWENSDPVESIGSAFVQGYLEEMHPNILILRHGASTVAGPVNHQQFVVVDEYIAFVGGMDLSCHRWDTRDHPISSSKFYPGKDYYHPRCVVPGEDVTNFRDDYRLFQENGRGSPRMPLHDVAFRIDGRAAYDVSVNFVQRWNYVRMEQKQVLLPELQYPDRENFFTKKSNRTFRCKAYLTRSISKWSVGFQTREQSIFNAIRHAIATAENFVYIETESIISIQQPMEMSEVTMSLADAIVNRVRRAVKEEKPLRVVVVLPMYPKGDLSDPTIHRMIYWQRRTIDYIEQKIIECTQGRLSGPSDYINFYSLANLAFIDEQPRVEQIYLQSTTIITDSIVISGSANLTMHSLVGDRDSELAVVMENPKLCETLRRDLWNEHVGTEQSPLLTGDFLTDLDVWDRIAHANTRVIRHLFEKSTPLGKAKVYGEFISSEKRMRKLWKSGTVDPLKSFTALQNTVRGHLVRYPRSFLREDVETTTGLQHALLDIICPVTPFHFLMCMNGAAVVSYVEYSIQ